MPIDCMTFSKGSKNESLDVAVIPRLGSSCSGADLTSLEKFEEEAVDTIVPALLESQEGRELSSPWLTPLKGLQRVLRP